VSACGSPIRGCAGRMYSNVAQKLIASHLLSGEMKPGEEIGLRIDRTLTQDATGTLVMLEAEGASLAGFAAQPAQPALIHFQTTGRLKVDGNAR
jgi:hypothetical protein